MSDKMREAAKAAVKQIQAWEESLFDEFIEGAKETLESALTQQPENRHWAAQDPGAADQFRCEAKAAREQLGFDRDADDISPAELRRAIKQLQAQQPESEPVALMDDDSPAKAVGEIGNQIHNLGCEYQNDEELSDRLAEIAHSAWKLQRDLIRSPQPTPQLPEGWDIIVTAPHNREIEVTDGSYVIRAALEEVDYSETLDRGLLGWVSQQFELNPKFSGASQFPGYPLSSH